MNVSTTEMLQRLGAGEGIAAVCDAAGITRPQFDAWWRVECEQRVPSTQGRRPAPVVADVEIVRDTHGIPHIFAQNDDDLFTAYGYAMAQDRLWQMDYLRRRGQGRLSEVLGSAGLDLDVIARTVGLNRIAAAEEKALAPETARLLAAFAKGVNAVITEMSDCLPIEFALLDYAPEPWSPLDTLAVWAEFRYYLTVRFPVIVLPELARRALGDEALFGAFLTPEAGDESIVPPGSYPAAGASEGVGATVGDPEEGIGSNNWAVDGAHAVNAMPMVASDPHIAFGATGCWYEAHLQGGSFNVTGAGYVGVPGLIFGRTEGVAWGITNNICSQRDLYLEHSDAEHPDAFLYDGAWEAARTAEETIKVKGAADVVKTVRYSRNGPIVDEILPAPARATGPIALRWLGATSDCSEIPSMWAMNRARSADEFRAATRGWRCPTWSAVFADVEGHIGYQSVGRIPIRHNWTRGYRTGWDPAHQWQGLIPFEGMPAIKDPANGWVRSANNRTAPADYPYPLSGTWSSGHRAQRIRNMLEAQDRFGFDDFSRMHLDVLSLRAVACVPRWLSALDGAKDDGKDGRLGEVADRLRAWDCRMEVDRVGATLFDIFFRYWSEAVARERFAPELAPVMAGAIGGLASDLLESDRCGWFQNTDRVAAIVGATTQMLDELTGRFGEDMRRWTWGNAHKIALRHHLSGRGDLGALLDRGGQAVRGNGLTVCNTGYDPNYMASMGANYRLIADLSVKPPTLHAVDAAGESGHPGSAHYGDQLNDWLHGRYHPLPLDRAGAEAIGRSRVTLGGING